jgi:RimJ/RimL family protein N-acetyltransferase
VHDSDAGRGAGCDLVIRPLREGEVDLFTSMPGSSGPWHPDFVRDYRELLAARHYRLPWTWVALRGNTVVARAAWWGFPDSDAPYTLDWLEFATEPDGAELVRAAHRVLRNPDGATPEYHLFVPLDWRDRRPVRELTERRLSAALGAGMDVLVKRWSYLWTLSDGPQPQPPGRLRFRSVTAKDTDLLVDVLARVATGSLDAATQAKRARHPTAAAFGRAELTDLESFPAPRAWWRLAYDTGGELVGLAVPTRNYAIPVVGYIAVLPEHRGRGYVDELLAETTRVLVEHGADRIGADTDATNTPMAAAFDRAGYRKLKVRLVIGSRL